MKRIFKYMLNRVSQLLALPAALLCGLEKWSFGHHETIFSFFAHSYSLFPGVPGCFLRRAFYSLTLDQCSINSHIGFGTIFAHRKSIVEENVYTGNYCVIGAAHIGKGCILGSRVSLLSGKNQHSKEKDGGWGAFDTERVHQIKVASNVWIGEGAIVMADIGEGSLVAAGAVVTSNVSPNVVVAGNPARVIRAINSRGV